MKCQLGETDISEFTEVSKSSSAAEDLNDKQRSTMGGRPDMILQYVHHLARKLESEGHRDVEIRVQSAVSLNGRKDRPMIDPKADLAAEPRTPRHAEWILPLTEPLPDRGERK